MQGLVDYHTHSLLSDGSGSYEEMVLAAIEKGLEEIGFSDHVSLKPVTWAMQDVDLPVMTGQIINIRKKFGHLIHIRYGIEMDYFPGKEAEISGIIKSLPLDYVIGSVHFIDDWNFDGDTSYYGKWSNDELYRIYFDLVQKAAKSGLFDILGHVDLIKKFAIFPETDQTPLLEETAEICARSGVVIEVNTAGLDKPCTEFYPGHHLLEIFHSREVPVTMSSDAHHPDQIARHYEQALRQIRNAGYHQIMKFHKRDKTAMKIVTA